MTARAEGDRPWHYALAGALMVGGPLARYLYYERYPLSAPEVAVLVGALAAMGAAVAWLGRRGGRRAAAVVFAALLVLFLDFQFDIQKHLWLAPLGVGCVAASVWLSRRRASVACLVLVAFYLSGLPARSREGFAIVNERSAGSRPGMRPIVHVILDAQLGIGGLRATGDTATARIVSEFYTRRGFDVYEGAYSRYFLTRYSVPLALSLGARAESSMVEPLPGARRFRMSANPYFARLQDRGYRLHVYQSSYLDYCHTSGIVVSTCVQAPATSVSNISYLPTNWWGKARRIIEFYQLHNSALAKVIPPWNARLSYRRSFAGRGLAQIHSADSVLRARRDPSAAFFLHILLPHAPYEMNAQCEPHPNPDDALLKTGYGPQVLCTHRALGSLLDHVDEVFGPRRAIVIVHGDHGARNTGLDPVDDLIDRYRSENFNAGFSTLLAVRHPESRGLVYREPVPLQDVLWAFVNSDFREVPSSRWRHFVYSTFTKDRWARRMRVLRPEEMPWSARSQPTSTAGPPR